jgi:phosphoribosylanthranilate isomerase
MIIKTCGLRVPDNIAAIAKLPIDWLGFIAFPKSSRYVGRGESELTRYLAGADLPQERVGVFVNANNKEISAAVRELGLTMLQLHGEESPASCGELQQFLQEEEGRALPLIKAFRVGPDFDFEYTRAYAPYCAYFLFDTKGQTHGGIGHKFDWEVLSNYRGDTPFLLSGGIGPEDAEAVLAVQHPQLAGIDLNSKFEIAPALKHTQQLDYFLHQLFHHKTDTLSP